jgi:uncharacterized protein YjbI with pentapeptide repeats
MAPEQPPWRRKKRQRRMVIIGILIACAMIALVFAGYWYWGWTGFAGKTLWDWLTLLGVLAVPVVVGLATIWFTERQSQTSEAANKQQHETDMQIAENQQQEAALQAYFDKMSELLLEKRLRESEQNAEVRNIARARTLTVLRRLDAERNRSLLQFLSESGLIRQGNDIIDLKVATLSGAKLSGTDLSQTDLSEVNLSGADLSQADLSKANLNRANLSGTLSSGTILSGADLSGADLSGADLSGAFLLGAMLSWANLSQANLSQASLIGANLSGATLNEVNLSGANLSGAKVTTDQLAKVRSLEGATLPDGTKHMVVEPTRLIQIKE